MIKKIVRVFGAYGIVGGLRYAVKKATGRAALEESVDSLYYYLNRYCDIGAFPKAEGRLRALQLCAVSLKLDTGGRLPALDGRLFEIKAPF